MTQISWKVSCWKTCSRLIGLLNCVYSFGINEIFHVYSTSVAQPHLVIQAAFSKLHNATFQGKKRRKVALNQTNLAGTRRLKVTWWLWQCYFTLPASFDVFQWHRTFFSRGEEGSHRVTSLHRAVSPWNWGVRLGLFSSLYAVANFVILRGVM